MHAMTFDPHMNVHTVTDETGTVLYAGNSYLHARDAAGDPEAVAEVNRLADKQEEFLKRRKWQEAEARKHVAAKEAAKEAALNLDGLL